MFFNFPSLLLPYRKVTGQFFSSVFIRKITLKAHKLFSCTLSLRPEMLGIFTRRAGHSSFLVYTTEGVLGQFSMKTHKKYIPMKLKKYINWPSKCPNMPINLLSGKWPKAIDRTWYSRQLTQRASVQPALSENCLLQATPTPTPSHINTSVFPGQQIHTGICCLISAIGKQKTRGQTQPMRQVSPASGRPLPDTRGCGSQEGGSVDRTVAPQAWESEFSKRKTQAGTVAASNRHLGGRDRGSQQQAGSLDLGDSMSSGCRERP